MYLFLDFETIFELFFYTHNNLLQMRIVMLCNIIVILGIHNKIVITFVNRNMERHLLRTWWGSPG